MRRGVECRAGGTGAESGGSHQSIRSLFSGDFGKPVRHLPRKQYSYTAQRADTAVRPYAEDSYPSATFQRMMRRMMNRQTYQPCNAMRDGMWNGRASRRTQVSTTKQASKPSAGIGTTVEHPCRKRIEYTKSPQNPAPRADTAVRPYAED